MEKNPDFDVNTIITQRLEQMYNQPRLEFDVVAASLDFDLSSFRAAGGKLIIWHRLTDAIIPPNRSILDREKRQACHGE